MCPEKKSILNQIFNINMYVRNTRTLADHHNINETIEQKLLLLRRTCENREEKNWERVL